MESEEKEKGTSEEWLKSCRKNRKSREWKRIGGRERGEQDGIEMRKIGEK